MGAVGEVDIRDGSGRAPTAGDGGGPASPPEGNGRRAGRPRGRGGRGETLSIGQLSALTGVSSRAIRYYEELGVLPPPPRSPGGTRRYPREFRLYLEGALALKELGFRLDEIASIGRAALGQPLPAEQRARLADLLGRHVAALEHRLDVLARLRGALLGEGGKLRAAAGGRDGANGGNGGNDRGGDGEASRRGRRLARYAEILGVPADP